MYMHVLHQENVTSIGWIKSMSEGLGPTSLLFQIISLLYQPLL